MSKKKKLEPTITPADEIRALAKLEDTASEVRSRLDRAGKQVRPDTAYWESVEAVLEAFDPRALPYAERFVEAWEKSFRRLMVDEMDVDEANQVDYAVPYGYWAHRDAAHVAIFKEPPRFKRPPTPAILREQRVTPRQIATIYHWLDEEGQPDEERVLREFENPGSELTEEAMAELEQFTLAQHGFVYQEKEPARSI
jgi:hypothetical protein